MNERRAADEDGRQADDVEEDASDAPSLVADEPPPDAELEREQERRRRPAALLSLFALGVVYGDIGWARACFGRSLITGS